MSKIIPFGVARLAFLLAASVVCVVGAAQAQTPSTAVSLANPASRNCVDKGGQLTIESNGKGGQFGVCTFADSRQCEEWAMMRGDCRTGGIKVAGFATPAARYCAITGGAYTVISASNTPDEQGKCAFKGGRSCDAAAYLAGTCTRTGARVAAAPAPTDAPSATMTNTINAKFMCDDGKSIAAIFINGAKSSVKLTLSDGRALALPQVRSGSGARYANANESVVFWNKGDTAFIDENGKSTYSGCSTQR
jgi:putative hemolysin